MNLRSAGLILIVTLSASCDAPTDPARSAGSEQAAAAYLDTALRIAADHALRRHEIDWPELRHETALRAEGASDTEDTYPAIRFLLAALGDGHSAFLPRATGPAGAPRIRVTTERLNDRIGLVRLYGGPGGGGAAVAASIQAAIQAVDAPQVCSWILDLRHDRGGDLWPKLAGLGALLGNGVGGGFVDSDGHVRRWGYLDGAVGVEGDSPVLTLRPYRPHHAAPAVAVLLGPRTASSAEAVAGAFRGRPDTRSFGAPTAGLSTANQGFYLSDGALLVLTVARLQDRSGRTLEGPVHPDEAVPDGLGDPALARALTWLGGARPACSP